MSKVWIVQTGISFEGGAVEAVFSNKESAINWVADYAQKRNKDREAYINANPDKRFSSDTYYTDRRWEYLPDETGLAWSNSTSYAVAEEWEIDNNEKT